MPRSARLASLLLLLAQATPALATCDAIPGTIGRFRGAGGVLDRPFARPGDVVDLAIDPGCSGGSASSPSAGDVVSIVFRGHAGPASAVVVAPSCDAVLAVRASCETALGGGTVTCVPSADAGVEAIARDDGTHLRFRFPDTDAVVADAGDPGTLADGRGLSGPAAIAVTRAGAPLPCGLGAASCREQSGVVACVDELLLDDGACGDTPHPVFDHFTALPPANDFGGICSDPVPPCTGDAAELRAAVDAAGNLLVPMDWRRVLVRRTDVPVPRLLRGSIRLEAFEGTGEPVSITDPTALGAFSLRGAALPPLFTPQADPAAADRLTLFGSSDAPEGVLRIARRARCQGGPLEGGACRRDADCAPGTCGGGFFDFASRVFRGVGPLVLARGGCLGGATPLAACSAAAECAGGDCVTFSAVAADPVPLDGLNVVDGGFAFVSSERLVGEDRNGDGDDVDDVVQLVDASSGAVLPVGEGGPGRAVARLREPPFSRPALAVAGDVVAFLEPEPQGGDRDANGDGDRADTVLRVYRLAGVEALDATGGQALVADAAPVVNGQSVAVEGGRVLFRTPEAAAARRTTTVVSLDHQGDPVSDACQLATAGTLSADGRFATFLSVAPDVTPDDAPCTFSALCRDAFVIDRDADADGLFDEPGGTAVARASAGEPGAPASVSAISADGRVVAFVSSAATLVPGDGNGLPDAFVYDVATGAVERVSVGSDGREANQGVVDAAGALAVSADGTIVAFASAASTLVADDHNGVTDVFVHDRRTGTTERASVSDTGQQGNAATFIRGLSALSLSADGRLVAFDSDASNLVPGDLNGASDVFVRDRAASRTRRASVGVRDEEANGGSRFAVLAPDGGSVAFTSVATNLAPGVTSGAVTVYVRDLRAAVTTAASVASDGTPADFVSGEPALSADGRFVAFASPAGTLVPGDGNGLQDVFVHDRLTGLTERVSLRADGSEVAAADRAESLGPALAADGRSAIFVSTEDLVPGVQRHRAVFARAADPDDVAADLTADGRHDAVVLRALDLAAPAGMPPRSLCPATEAAARGDVVAFLRPEAAGDAPGCPAGPDLNADGDAADVVVHRVVGNGPVENLALAARALALSDLRLAVLASEADQGSDRNGDGDADDLVVHVRAATGADGWRSLGLAADTVLARGGVVALLVPEAGQGGQDLNGDGDASDRVLHLLRADDGIESTGLAAEEMVASDTLIAFRVREAAQGGQDLNGDGDALDAVLFVYDVARGLVLATGQAVTPCRLEACDPRLPYRPLAGTVRFLTLEAEQGEDLNGDDDADDLVLQTFNVLSAPAGSSATSGGGLAARLGRRSGAARALVAVAAGVCPSTGAACAGDAGCPDGDRCIVPPGRCVADRGAPCRIGRPGDCGPDEFCGSDAGETAPTTCRRAGGECAADGDCAGDERCRGTGQRLQRLAIPLGAPGREVVPGMGRCVDGASGVEGATCRSDDDCPAGAACRADLVTAAVVDRDGDELPDVVDVCPETADPEQRDADGDGVGDACDRRTAGNGVREPGEECDGGDDAACPGQCRDDATCFCANETTTGSLRVRRDRGAVAARLALPLETYGGEPLLLRLSDAAGRVVASGVADDFAPTGAAAWKARRLSPGLVRARIARRGAGRQRVTVRARGWFAGDVALPLRLTVTIGDRCVAATMQRAPATTTTVTAPPTSSTVATTTTVASTTTTSTIAPGCCGAHRMVLETTAGGRFALGGLPETELPAGTRIVLDVGPPDAQCRHAVTVPPGGFEMPHFCARPFPFTADVVARGCAAGTALGAGTAWDGGAPGADPDLAVVADTSDGICNPPGEACLQQERAAAGNVLGSVAAVFGDGVANAPGLHLSVALPVVLHLWDVQEAPGEPSVCPDTDGASRVAEGVATVYSTLRLTTGRARARFADGNGDGCAFVGVDSGAERMVDGAPAAGPCCVPGQELRLAAAGADFTAGFIGDVLTTASIPARVAECLPAEEPGTCDALAGGGRTVTAVGAENDEILGLFPVDGGHVLAAGTSSGGQGWGVGLARYDADGRLDPTFGPSGSGRAWTDVAGRELEVRGVARDAEGRILASGWDPGGDVRPAAAGVARVLSDGRLDTTFGDGGGRFTPERGELVAVAVDHAGRVVAAGRTVDPGNGTHDFLVARFDATGHEDPTFGTGGFVHTDFAASGAEPLDDRGKAIVLEPDGRVVVGGTVGGSRVDEGISLSDFGLARYALDGRLDPTFGEGGLVRTGLGPRRGFVRALLRLEDGGYLMAGGSEGDDATGLDLVLVRYLADGRLDDRFGAGGVVRTRIGGDDEARALLARPDGSLLVAGRVRDPNDVTPAGERIEALHRWALLRYDLATGARDLSFGENGVTLTSFGGWEDHPTALLPLADGRLLAAGGHDPNGHHGYEGDFALARYLSDGRIDPSYGGPCGWETEPLLRLRP